jgi:hypothetical protein
MRTFETILIIVVWFALGIWGGRLYFSKPCVCPETLPTQVTDMFTIKGDTIYLKQDADFVISTRGIDIDTAGIIHRKNLHK